MRLKKSLIKKLGSPLTKRFHQQKLNTIMTKSSRLMKAQDRVPRFLNVHLKVAVKYIQSQVKQNNINSRMIFTIIINVQLTSAPNPSQYSLT
eukprot:403369879